MNILLHICCANCAIYPVRQLREQHHHVTGFFFNPNIHPYQEYRRRLDTLRDYAERTELTVVYRDEYLLEEFLSQVAASPSSRCGFCYQWRMEEAARHAAANGYNAFTTTLLYSRFQKHDMIRDYGQALARQYGIEFLYQDFRAGWNAGIDASRAMGLYRQQYCGCIYSEQDRYHPQRNN